MAFRPRIAIIGGGPSGLALSLLLQQRGISTTIYELRSKMTIEELDKPSGMLDLHEESGLKVIRECGLWEDFQAALGDCSEACRVLNPQGTILHTDEGELSNRPEIARNALTKILLQNVAPNCVKWDHKVMAVRAVFNDSTKATEIKIDLGADRVETYHFVVGADGAWSKVRALLTDVKPFYSGAQIITATLRNATTNFPDLVKLSGSGTMNALGAGNGIMTHRGLQDSIRVYAVVSTPYAKWAREIGLGGKTAAEVKVTLLDDEKLFRNWAPSLRNLLATAFDEETKDNPGNPAEIWPLYMLPIDHSWKQHRCATLVGDAAHLMTPWAGEGVNLALWDSLELADALGGVPVVEDAASWQEALEPRLREYEEVMLARAHEKAAETAKNKDMFMSDNGAEQMASFFKVYQDLADAAKES